MNHLAGFRNRVEMILTGLDMEAKAELAEGAAARAALPRTPAVVDVHLARLDRRTPPTRSRPPRCCGSPSRTATRAVVGRAFSSAAVELALASYPGFSRPRPRGRRTPYGVYWPALVPADAVEQVVVHADGRRVGGAAHRRRAAADRPRPSRRRRRRPARPGGVPLGTLVGARSGDKGGNANVGHLGARRRRATPGWSTC